MNFIPLVIARLLALFLRKKNHISTVLLGLYQFEDQYCSILGILQGGLLKFETFLSAGWGRL